MKNLYFYCEGQTEEKFVKSVLYGYFYSFNIHSTAIVHRTKETPTAIFKGGVTDYNKIVKEIKRYCNEHPNEKVTSFIDYYGLKNLPELQDLSSNIYTKIIQIEDKLFEDVGFRNFIPYISLHEFESLLFSDVSVFNEIDFDNNNFSNSLKSILQQFNNNPELINNSPITAPSKRIKSIIPGYSKVSDGILLSDSIGIENIISKCKHFSDWITKLKNI